MFPRTKSLEDYPGPEDMPKGIKGLISLREVEAFARAQVEQEHQEHKRQRSASLRGERPTKYQVAVERRQHDPSSSAVMEAHAANMRRSKSQRRPREERTESLVRTQSTPYATVATKKHKEENPSGLRGLWGSIKRTLSSNYREGTERINEHIDRTCAPHSSHHRRRLSQIHNYSRKDRYPQISKPVGPADLSNSVVQPIILPPRAVTGTSTEKTQLRERLAQDYQRQQAQPQLQHVKSGTKDVCPPHRDAIKSQAGVLDNVDAYLPLDTSNDERPTTAWPSKPTPAHTGTSSSKPAANIDVTSRYNANNIAQPTATGNTKIPSRTVPPQHIAAQAQTQATAASNPRPRSQKSQALNTEAGLCAICDKPAPSSSMKRALCNTCNNLGWKLDDVPSQPSVPILSMLKPAATRTAALSNKKPTPPLPSTQHQLAPQPTSTKPSPSVTSSSQNGKPLSNSPHSSSSSPSSSSSSSKKTVPIGAPTLARAQFTPENIHPAIRDDWVAWAGANMPAHPTQPQHTGETWHPHASTLPAPLNVPALHVPAPMVKRDGKALPEGGMDGVMRIAGPYPVREGPALPSPPVPMAVVSSSSSKAEKPQTRAQPVAHKDKDKGKGKPVRAQGKTANAHPADNPNLKSSGKLLYANNPAAAQSRAESIWDDVVPSDHGGWSDADIPPLPSLPALPSNPYLLPSTYSNPSLLNQRDYPSDAGGRRNPLGGFKGVGSDYFPPPPVPPPPPPPPPAPVTRDGKKEKRTSSVYSRNTMGLMQDAAGLPSSWQAWDEGQGWYDRTSILPKTPVKAKARASPERRR